MRGRPTVLTVLATLAAIALLAGCATIRPVLEAPRGFAEYGDKLIYRAVSPEGVLLRVRLVANDPPQSLEFWAEALENQLSGSGYARLGKEPFEAPAGKGILYEWAAPVGEEDWIYLSGLCVTTRGIAVAEAAGEYGTYQKRRQAIIESLRSLQLVEGAR